MSAEETVGRDADDHQLHVQRQFGAAGGRVFSEALSSAVLDNTVLWGNEANGVKNDVASQVAGPATATFSCIQDDVPGGGVPFGGAANGNIDLDPSFQDPLLGNYRLAGGSPAIDHGDNTKVPEDVADVDQNGDPDEPVPIDLDARPRFKDDPGSPNLGVADPPNYPDIVDMGAYEFEQCGACPQDVDGSGDVRVPDLITLLGCWGALPGNDPACPCLDSDGSGDIRVPDLITLLGLWGICP